MNQPGSGRPRPRQPDPDYRARIERSTKLEPLWAFCVAAILVALWAPAQAAAEHYPLFRWGPDLDVDGLTGGISYPEYGHTLRVQVFAWRSPVPAIDVSETYAGVALDPGSWTLPAAPPAPELFPIAVPASLRTAAARTGRLRVRVTMDHRVPIDLHEEWDEVAVVDRGGRVVARGRALLGTFGRQRLVGTPAGERIDGQSGGDRLSGRGGNDSLNGGTGNDRLDGASGDDALDGGDGDDVLRGGDGDDDLVEARFGHDRLYGGAGDDVLQGGRASDQLFGGPGDDVLRGDAGIDVLDCGDGEDVAFITSETERARLVGCEHVYVDPTPIPVRCTAGGTDEPETLLGTDGPDVCIGMGGDDDVEGRGGDHVLDGGPGDDRVFGRFGDDELDGGEGADEVEGGRGEDDLRGGPGDDRLNGGYGDDVVHAGPGADVVVARGGGTDRIDCGPGDDIAFVDSHDAVSNCETVERSGARRSR